MANGEESAPYTIKMVNEKTAPKFGAAERTYRIQFDIEKFNGSDLIDTYTKFEDGLTNFFTDFIKQATVNCDDKVKMKMSISQPQGGSEVFIPLQNLSYFTAETVMDHVADSNKEFPVEQGFLITVGTLQFP